MKDFILYCIKVIAAFAVAVVVAFFATSCRTVQTVVEYHDRYITDTLLRIDSTFIDRWHTIQEKGDTIWKHDSIVEYRYKVIDHDVEVIVHDSIPYPVEVVKEVVHNSGFAKFCIWFFFGAIALVLLIIAWKIIKKRYFRHT